MFEIDPGRGEIGLDAKNKACKNLNIERHMTYHAPTVKYTTAPLPENPATKLKLPQNYVKNLSLLSSLQQSTSGVLTQRQGSKPANAPHENYHTQGDFN